MLRLGILGAGGGKEHDVRCLSTAPDGELKKICDIKRTTVSATGSKNSIFLITTLNYQEMLDDPAH